MLAGAGKSTLMTALLRIVETDEGQILIDGQDIRDVGLAKLRSNIACIPQDPTLYSGKSIAFECVPYSILLLNSSWLLPSKVR